MDKIIIVMLVSISVISCRTTDHNIWTRNRIPYMNYGYSITRNIYPVDSLLLNINKYQVVHSEKTGHTFIIPLHVWTANRFSEKLMLSDPSCYLLEWDFSDYVKNLSGTPPFLKIKYRLPEFEIWDRRNVNRKDRRKSYYPIYFNKQPDFYHMILIRGDAINNMKHDNPTGQHFTKLKFPDEKSYYKVLIPAWMDHIPKIRRSDANLPILPVP